MNTTEHRLFSFRGESAAVRILLNPRQRFVGGFNEDARDGEAYAFLLVISKQRGGQLPKNVALEAEGSPPDIIEKPS